MNKKIEVTEEGGNKRLLRLADFLEKLPPKRFYYNRWVGKDDLPWEGDQDLSCGTTACALGWAATMPTFRKLGLHLEGTISGLGCVILGDPHTDYYSNYEAAEILFHLNDDESDHLFAPQNEREESSNYTPKMVAAKFRKFVAQRRANAQASKRNP